MSSKDAICHVQMKHLCLALKLSMFFGFPKFLSAKTDPRMTDASTSFSFAPPCFLLNWDKQTVYPRCFPHASLSHCQKDPVGVSCVGIDPTSQRHSNERIFAQTGYDCACTCGFALLGV